MNNEDERDYAEEEYNRAEMEQTVSRLRNSFNSGELRNLHKSE